MNWTSLMLAVVIPPASSMSYKLIVRSSSWDAVYCGWACSAAYGTGWTAVHHQWLWALAAAANTGLAIVLWWLGRRRRKRAPRAYGAKSRALVAALVWRAREKAVPRPVLRPVPEGN